LQTQICKNKKIVTYGLLFLLLIVYYFLNKNYGISIHCPIHEITGLYCPGCGITRMFFSILKLDFYQAFRYNPLVFILVIIYVVYRIIKLFKKDLLIKDKYLFLLLIILIIYGILRNIEIFNFLAPTEIIRRNI